MNPEKNHIGGKKQATGKLLYDNIYIKFQKQVRES